MIEGKRERLPVTAADAVFGFAAWLTTRQETLTIGARHACPAVIDVVAKWLEGQGLGTPSEHYPNNIVRVDDDGKPSAYDSAREALDVGQLTDEDLDAIAKAEQPEEVKQFDHED